MAAVVHPAPYRREALRRAPLVVLPEGRPAPRPAARRVGPGVYARRRAAAVLLLVGVALAVRLVLGALGGGPLTAPEPVHVPVAATTYVVQPGDTLWSVARRLDPRGDVRITVARLADANGGTSLQVGQRLHLP